jgi:hypothetical protein
VTVPQVHAGDAIPADHRVRKIDNIARFILASQQMSSSYSFIGRQSTHPNTDREVRIWLDVAALRKLGPFRSGTIRANYFTTARRDLASMKSAVHWHMHQERRSSFR